MQSVLAKIISFIMSILAFLGLVKPAPAPTATLDSYAVKDGVVEYCFSANATTGYAWTAEVEGDCVVLIDSRYVQDDRAEINGVALAGVGGAQYFDFKAVGEGRATITFTYGRSFSGEVAKVVVSVVTVDADKNVSVYSFSEKSL
ncbi:MAG: protease inhibitor I42 family protein [Clostridiales bacterium]|nr:protease inhibitor I42 family protein [Clostridiales bacterium]